MKNVLKSKRFVVRKSLIGKNQVITFTTKKGDVVTYNHDKVFELSDILSSYLWVGGGVFNHTMCSKMTQVN